MQLPSSHPDYSRSRRLATLFSLTLEDYDTILAYQGGLCAICKKPPKVGGVRLSVDHDHKTGLVRGLVHGQCNRAIGWCRDNPEIAYQIYEYLNNPPATIALGDSRFGRVGRVTNKRKRVRRKKRG